ncbi:MAG TPA: sugar phosphate isomerase/epimerase [Lacipirellulaceae bacterium]|nr:sugar phosphate isomerase/epimerase [Lacipirellulaceae bacterium]
MPTLSMNEVTTFRWSLEEDIRGYVAAGYEGIGAWRHKLADYSDEQAVDLIAESGLRVTNLSWAGGFTGSDGRSLDEGVHDATQALRLAGALGAGCLVVYPGGRNNHILTHAERLLTSALEQLLDFAADVEVVLAIEPMHPACAGEWTFLTELEATVAFIERFNSPFLKLVFDTYHFGHDRAVFANLAELVPHIGIVHLADRMKPHGIDQERCPLGVGRLELTAIVRGLVEAGYVGDFDVELIGPQLEPSEYESLLRTSLEFFERVLAPA